MRQDESTILIFDWEFCLPAAPAGWDLLYFIFSGGKSVEETVPGTNMGTGGAWWFA